MKTSPIVNFINNSDQSLNALLKEMRKYPTLSAERERELAIKSRQGDAKAREELIMSNLPAAVHIANKWAAERMPLRDLIGPAVEGLILALDKYDPKSENRVLSYVKWKVEERVQAYSESMRSGMVLPHRQCNLLSSLRSARQRLEQEMGRSIDDQTLAMLLSDELGHDVHDLVCAMRAERFDTFDGGRSNNEDDEDERLTYKDRMADDNNVEECYLTEEMHALLHDGLKQLPERTAKVLSMLFGLEGESMRVKDIAAALGITTETVRLHKERGLAMLREWLTSCVAA